MITGKLQESFRISESTNKMLAKQIGKKILATNNIVNRGQFVNSLFAERYCIRIAEPARNNLNRTTIDMPVEISKLVHTEANSLGITISKLLEEVIKNGPTFFIDTIV